MITPCVGICQMTLNSEVCKGCKRTKEEIENWDSYTYYHQMKIMNRLGYGIRMGREERLRRYERG
jgi:predicted Fe-S protein YdhL (DUF1289 family)